MPGKALVFSQHIAHKEPEYPCAQDDEWNPVHGHECVRGVDHNLAEIIRIPCPGEESGLDQTDAKRILRILRPSLVRE